MKESRKKRYLEKMNHIKQRISNFNSWKHEFFLDEKTKLACYKAMQEIIEGCMDIVAMMVKDEKEIPQDDYTNIEILKKKGIISEKIANALKELNGLRNRIIYEYNHLEDEIAITSMEELLTEIEKFFQVVKEWLKKRI